MWLDGSFVMGFVTASRVSHHVLDKIGICKTFALPIFNVNHSIQIYSGYGHKHALIEIRHNILMQFQGSYVEVKKLN